jgi:hypothetical protein
MVSDIPAGSRETGWDFFNMQCSGSRSPHLPSYLMCDACVGVAHQLVLSLAYAHR